MPWFRKRWGQFWPLVTAQTPSLPWPKILSVTPAYLLAEDKVEELLNQLDNIFLLDNNRATDALQDALQTYRASPFRPAAIAGQSYPADPPKLRKLLRGYLGQLPETEELETGSGLISPHIDYQRGGMVYARVWKRVARLAREADCVVILGTDHNSAIPAQITLTRQSYATPFGILPTDQKVVNAIADVLGEETVFQSELHHRKEWSIELSAVWLHFMRDEKPCPIVPILCGPFHHFIGNGHLPADDIRLNAMVQAIKQATAGRKVLVVASGDLAHIGPSFGGDPIDAAGLTQLQDDDEKLLAPVVIGDAETFFEVIRSEGDSRNICGTSCIYLAMKLMGNVKGEPISYDRCLADEDETSFVSVAGVAFV